MGHYDNCYEADDKSEEYLMRGLKAKDAEIEKLKAEIAKLEAIIESRG